MVLKTNPLLFLQMMSDEDAQTQNRDELEQKGLSLENSELTEMQASSS